MGPGVAQLDDDLSDAARAADNVADDAARMDRELSQAVRSTADLEDELRDVERAADRAADETRRIDDAANDAVGSFGRAGRTLGTIAVAAGAAIGLREITQFFGDTVTAASDLSESINAVDVVFGDASQSILDFGADSSDAVFLSAAAFNELAAVTGTLLQGFGIGVQDAADLTIVLTERASDLASVFNTEVSVALEAINAAIRGETEQIRRFTGSFSIDEVKRFGREMFNVTGELTSQQQALAAVEFILVKTQAVQGDASATADEYANRQRALNEAWTNAKAAIGENLIPGLERLIPLLIAASDAAARNAPAIARNIQDTGSVIGDLFGTIGNLGQAIAAIPFDDLTFSDTRAQFTEAGESLQSFADTAFGASSIIRDFLGVLADGEDNASDFADVLQTLADSGDLSADLFDQIADAASLGGVGLEAQASAIREVLRAGQLTAPQIAVLTSAFRQMTTALGQPELIDEFSNELGFAAIAADLFGFSIEDAVDLALLFGEASRRTSGSLRDFGLAAELADKNLFLYARTQAEAVDEAAQLKEELDGLSPLVKAVGDAAGLSDQGLLDYRDALDEASDAADRFRTLTLELTDPVFAAARAQERLTDAQEALADGDAEATLQDLALLALDVAEAQAEADATARALGDINVADGRFGQSIRVLSELLGITTGEVLQLLEDAGVINELDVGFEVVIAVDDDDLNTAIGRIGDLSLTIPVEFAGVDIGATTVPGGTGGQGGTIRGGGAIEGADAGVVVNINSPTSQDLVGDAAQAGNIVAGLVGATSAFRGTG